MALSLRWVNDDERERVAETRMLCYSPASRERAAYVERLNNDARSRAGDYLLAEENGVAVGTSTGMALTMWVRGGAVSCQGVAHVGTVKTHRRRSGGGIGTVLMNETLRSARERGFVLSALMPFRGTFYEHFGYGFMERRADWTIPMAILPQRENDEFRFYRESDFEELVRFKQRLTERTHGDIERPAALWKQYLDGSDDGHCVVERSGDGPIRSFIYFVQTHHQHQDTLKVDEALYEDAGGLRRVLGFLGSLRDQYAFASMVVPGDLPLNRLLVEDQMTHRQNRNHATAEVRPFNRMQVRVLDHAKLINAMKSLPRDRSGKVVVAIRETEGATSKIAIELKDGAAAASATDASADVEMSDRMWAAVALGDLPATRAADLGLIAVTNRTPLGVLDALSAGAAPFCREYF
jgi:predicted acetyltransferase